MKYIQFHLTKQIKKLHDFCIFVIQTLQTRKQEKKREIIIIAHIPLLFIPFLSRSRQ